MRSTRAAQIVIILLISGLIAFIYFSARNTSSALVKPESGHKGSESSVQRTDEPFDFEKYLKLIRDEAPKKELETIDVLEQNYRSQPSRESMQHLAEAYDKLGFPA